MARQMEGFLSDPKDPLRELTRKLYWAVSSTIPLNTAQKKTTFSWAADLADKLIARAAVLPPPAIRPQNLGGKAFAMRKKSGYAAQAGGGAAGSLDRATSAALPSQLMRRGAVSHPLPTTQDMADFGEDQARMKAAAIVYMKGGVTGGSRNQQPAEDGPCKH